ncbi:hypothetical protein, partial [Cetobacterium sp.]|uniref:hypothetical protein n=1 Tax=Cetobacterium sp. TaxID=2071632 RepID=UPI003EE7179E
MNKKRNIYIEILCGIILILLLGNAYMRNVYDTKKTVTKKMKAYLREKYKEDFEIYALRPVNGGYSAYIIPSNDVNTPKGDDDFYEATVAMRTKPIYFLGQHMFNLHKDLIDTQWRVEVKEKFNSLIGKEIEKLFGKNYLTALEMKLTRDLLKKEKFSHTMTEEDIQKILTRNEIEISGGIYIFGRVESEADREYYRKQIYEFIQYLKAENMFDYVSLRMAIVDERVISKEYLNNKKLKDDLSKLFLEGTKDNIRKNVIDTIGENYTINEKYISQINKGIFSGMHGLNKYPEIKGGILLSESIYTPKYIKSNALLQGKVKAKEYN